MWRLPRSANSVPSARPMPRAVSSERSTSATPRMSYSRKIRGFIAGLVYHRARARGICTRFVIGKVSYRAGMKPGEVVAARFEIERLAGEGGMGAVYRALDRHSGEPVALKLLLDHTDAGIARFQIEASLLAELRHPGIVRYVAHGQMPGGTHWLAMEWLDG